MPVSSSFQLSLRERLARSFSSGRLVRPFARPGRVAPGFSFCSAFSFDDLLHEVNS